MNAADISAARTAAVAATMDRIRAIEQDAIEQDTGITRAALAAMERELQNLAAQEHLFPSAEFPPPPDGETGSRRYLLQSDPDDRFSIYMNALNPGNASRPHNHTTWAVVVAVEGQELNRVYRRTDDGSNPERASLVMDHEVMVEPGRGICLMPDDIHSIHTTGSRPTRHLHT
jgi:predicted metal-dependent enzyme (double-stranded beta helix superfamily)